MVSGRFLWVWGGSTHQVSIPPLALTRKCGGYRYMSVCFNNQSMTTADVGKHRALEIDPEEYMRCSELRKKVCPVFAEVQLDEQKVRTQWPDRAVPTAILQGAQAMDTLLTFKHTLD